MARMEVRLNDYEEQKLKELAELTGLNRSSILKKVLYSSSDSSEDRLLILRYFQKIGNMMDQGDYEHAREEMMNLCLTLNS